MKVEGTKFIKIGTKVIKYFLVSLFHKTQIKKKEMGYEGPHLFCVYFYQFKAGNL